MFGLEHDVIAFYNTDRGTRVAGKIAVIKPNEKKGGYDISLKVHVVITDDKFHDDNSIVEAHSSWLKLDDGGDWTDAEINFQLFLALGYVPGVRDRDAKRAASLT